MKKLVIAFILFSMLAAAQAPNKMSFQTVVRNNLGKLVVNKSIGVRLSILQTTSNGTAVYVETHSKTSNVNGLLTLEVSTGIVTSGSFATIDWSQGPYFLKTEMDVNGGTSYTITGITEFMSVPYALYAANSQPGKDGLNGVPGPAGPAGNGFSNGSAKNQIMYWDGSKWVTLSPGLNEQVLTVSNGNLTWSFIQGYGRSITDVEGNLYRTVNIGNQQWMAENLKVTLYNDGTTIPNISDVTQWQNNTTGAWCYYNNDEANNEKYGKLYNWYAVSKTTNGNKNICPTGWHVPSDLEWKALIDYLGGWTVAGGKMKEVGTTIWNSPNTKASNESLFTGRPGGTCDYGYYNDIGQTGAWWSSTIYYTTNALFHYLYNSGGDVGSQHDGMGAGKSVRCIRD